MAEEDKGGTMDFHELAARLLMSAQGRGDGPVPAVYGQPSIKEGEAATDYLEGLGLIGKNRGLSWHSFNFIAHLTLEGKALIGLRSDVNKIAEHFRQQDNPSSPAIDQSTHIHGNNIGAVVTHSKLEDSPIIFNSSVTEQITKIEQALEEDTSLTNGERQDALIYVKTLKSQLQRSKTNRTIVERLLDTLGNITSIGQLIVALSGMLS